MKMIAKKEALKDLKTSKYERALRLVEYSTNKKYMTPDLSDLSTMEESMKRVRQLLIGRKLKIKEMNESHRRSPPKKSL
jgi:hypothetical protein